MEKRRNLVSYLLPFLILLSVLLPFIEAFDLSLIILVIILVAVVLVVAVVLNRRSRGNGMPREFQGIPSPPQVRLSIGRWILLPVALIVVIGFVLAQNWWLNVNILRTMYLIKANLDWWKLTFLDNHYFYACIAIGLLIAVSDPRVRIERDAEGRRRFYLHSKTWGVISTLRGQMFELGFNLFPAKDAAPLDDRITLKKGLLWKGVEFLLGAIVIGPIVARDMALTFLLIADYIQTQSLSWWGFIQQTFSVLSTVLLTPDVGAGVIGNTPLGTWLIANSPVLEFLRLLQTPILVLGAVWIARLVVTALFDLRRGRLVRVFRSVVLIGLILAVPILLQVPTQTFDVTTPFYIRTMVAGVAILAVLAIFLSLKPVWVEWTMGRIFRNRLILGLLVLLVSTSLLYGPLVVATQYAPAMQGNWEDWLWRPRFLPNVEYTRWATGLERIREDNVTSALNTGENLETLGRVRIFNDQASVLRLKPSIGVNWMDFNPEPAKQVDIIWVDGREYWVAPLTLVLPTVGGAEDVWRSQRMLYTHSERVLAIDAASGEIVPIETVFNLTDPVSLYYGEGGLYTASKMVYLDIPGFAETHLPERALTTFEGVPDYTLTGFERFWFFSGLSGLEGLRWDFGRGDWGDVKMLYVRDVNERVSNFLLPGMIIDQDPYLVSDGQNVYFALYVYVERAMPTQYLDYPINDDQFWRLFGVVLVDAYSGEVQGYLLGQDETNYIVDFYRSMYPQWDAPVPEWLVPQLRYPEFLFERQIDSYNIYHVSNPDKWQKSSDFFEDSPIEDVRYVVITFNGTTYWAGVRLVEFFESPGQNLAAMYVALNGGNVGDVFLLRIDDSAVIGPQTALDSVSNTGATKSLLTLNPNWKPGNILMYVLNNTLYYYIPYYAETTTTLSPVMMVTVDALSQKLGYYVISNPQDPVEVGRAAEKAYLNLVGQQLELTAEARKTKVLDELTRRGYDLRTPQIISADASFQEAVVGYFTDEEWDETNSTITSFLQTWADPSTVDIILIQETTINGMRYLEISVLINRAGVVYQHFMKIGYSRG